MGDRSRKCWRRFTIDDVASALGAEQAQMLEKLMKEKQEATKEKQEATKATGEVEQVEQVDGGVSESDDMDDHPKGGGTASAQAVAASAVPSGLAERLGVVAKVQKEMAEDLYRNHVRLEEAKGAKVNAFHAALGPWCKRIAGRPQVSRIMTSTFHIDIALKEMGNPREGTEWVKKELKEARLDALTFVTSPN